MTGSLPAQCAVVGGGRMGSGIAHALLLAGVDVCLVEVDASAHERARAAIRTSAQRSVDRGFAGSTDALLQNLRLETSLDSLADAGLVIEAVPELLDLKRSVIAGVAAAVAPDAVIATNTSSIPLARLADAGGDESRFIGLHFFNPVPASTLVEIVVAGGTAPALVDDARGWVVQLGKTPIVVRDSPGFASSRLGVLLGVEAIRMLEDGVASAEDIDLAMTLGYKHPVGPLRLTDIVGLDVRLDIARQLESEFGERFTPPQLLVDMVQEGRLGQKSGQGFFDWSAAATI